MRREPDPLQIALKSPDQREIVILIAALDAYSIASSPPQSRHQIDLSALGGSNVVFAVARTRDGEALGDAAIVLDPEYGR
jgi:putative acetyltransferase